MKKTRRVCGAKLRGKDRTCQKPPMANGRCRLHGGLTPSGPDSANYKHGRYAEAFKGQLAERFKRQESDPQPLDMITDLNVQRTLLEEFLAQMSKRKKIPLSHLAAANDLAKDAVKSAAIITQARQKQAFTAAEAKFIKQGIILLMEKYVPDPDRRRGFIAELVTLIPDRDDAEGSEPASLPAGSAETG